MNINIVLNAVESLREKYPEPCKFQACMNLSDYEKIVKGTEFENAELKECFGLKYVENVFGISLITFARNDRGFIIVFPIANIMI